MFNREREMRPIVTEWVAAKQLHPVYETSISHLVDIIGVRFAPRVKREMPELERMVAVELKLFDISGVLHQCLNNKWIVNQSWAAMPKDVVASMRPKSITAFAENGIGLLAVSNEVAVVIEAVETPLEPCGRHQTMRKRFWRYLRKQIREGELGVR